jgi:hypothetical protein
VPLVILGHAIEECVDRGESVTERVVFDHSQMVAYR